MSGAAAKALPALGRGRPRRRGPTLRDSDLRAYAEITGDYNPLHFDDAFAAATRFGRRVAQGGITAGLLNALVPGPARPGWSSRAVADLHALAYSDTS
jgi:acyl dehydratase